MFGENYDANAKPIHVLQFSNPKQEEKEHHKSLNLFTCHLLIENFEIVRNLLIELGHIKSCFLKKNRNVAIQMVSEEGRVDSKIWLDMIKHQKILSLVTQILWEKVCCIVCTRMYFM